MRVYAMIPARSGSKGLPDKNIKPLAGHPLLAHAVAFAKKLPVDRAFVSTDSEQYREIAEAYGAEVPQLRGDDAAADTAMEENVIADFMRWGIEPPDVWVWLKPTSPFRSVEKVEAALRILAKSECYHSVRIVSEADARIQVKDRDGFLVPLTSHWPAGRSKCRRVEVPQAYKPFNLEVFRHAMWERRGKDFMGSRIYPVVAHKITGLDVDDADDFALIEAVIAGKPPFLPEFLHVPEADPMAKWKYTVGEMIKDLSEFDPSLEIRIATEDAEEFTVGTIYSGDGTVWVDVDPADDDAGDPMPVIALS